jgi:hypothetical protein
MEGVLGHDFALIRLYRAAGNRVGEIESERDRIIERMRVEELGGRRKREI